MKMKTIKAALIALSLGSVAWANDGASFLAGGTFLVSKPAYGITATGGAVNFDLHFPIKSIAGLQLGMRNFIATAKWSDYANTMVNDNMKDLDREFYWAGTSIGPKFVTPGSTYFVGTAGLLIAANYAVEKTFGTANHIDSKVLNERADLSLGGEGSVGVGYRQASSGFTMEFTLVGQGASSEQAPGIMMSIGPKITFGMSL